MNLLFISAVSLSALLGGDIPISTGDWEPYVSSRREGNGLVAEIVTAAFREVGDTVRFEFVPWSRAENNVKAGKTYAAFPYVKNAEREAIYDFSHRVFYSTGRLFYYKPVMKQEVKFSKPEDLVNHKVGGVRGYWYVDPWTKAGVKLDLSNSDEQNFRKLQAGRVDLIVAEELVGRGLIQELFPDKTDQFQTLPTPTDQSELFLLVSRSYPNAVEITKRFNDGLDRIKKKGVYKKILAKYGIKE